jgi:tetratricopeptide (TPR) repeat protein
MVTKTLLFILISVTIFGCDQFTSKKFNCKNLTENYWETIADYKPEKNMEFISLLNEVIQESPGCKNAYALRGELLFQIGNYNKAKKDFLNLSKIDSNNVYAYFELGLISELQRSFDSAVVFYERAISKKVNGSFVTDKNNDAQKIFGNRGFDVKYVSLKLRKGIANYYKGSLKAAFIDLNYCIKEQYRLSEAYLYRALVYSSINNSKKACEDFNQAKNYGNNDVNADIQKHCK